MLLIRDGWRAEKLTVAGKSLLPPHNADFIDMSANCCRQQNSLNCHTPISSVLITETHSKLLDFSSKNAVHWYTQCESIQRQTCVRRLRSDCRDCPSAGPMRRLVCLVASLAAFLPRAVCASAFMAIGPCQIRMQSEKLRETWKTHKPFAYHAFAWIKYQPRRFGRRKAGHDVFDTCILGL